MSDDLKEQNKPTVSSSTSGSTSSILISDPLAKPTSLLPPQQQEPFFLSSSPYPTMQTSTPASLISLLILAANQLSSLETPVESKQPMKSYAEQLLDYGYQEKNIKSILTLCTAQKHIKPNLEKNVTDTLIAFCVAIDIWERENVISKDYIVKIIVNSENPRNIEALLKYLATIHQDVNPFDKGDQYYSSDELFRILRFHDGHKVLKILAENHEKYIAYFETCKRIMHIAGHGYGLKNIKAIGRDPGRLHKLKFSPDWVLKTLSAVGGSKRFIAIAEKREEELDNIPVQVENKRKRKATASSSVFPQPTPSSQFTGINVNPLLGSNPLHHKQQQQTYFPFFSSPHTPVLANVSPIDEAKLVTATNPNLFIEKPGVK